MEPILCQVQGCPNADYRQYGHVLLCKEHSLEIRNNKIKPKCGIKLCFHEATRHCFCRTHYQRIYRYCMKNDLNFPWQEKKKHSKEYLDKISTNNKSVIHLKPRFLNTKNYITLNFPDSDIDMGIKKGTNKESRRTTLLKNICKLYPWVQKWYKYDLQYKRSVEYMSHPLILNKMDLEQFSPETLYDLVLGLCKLVESSNFIKPVL